MQDIRSERGLVQRPLSRADGHPPGQVQLGHHALGSSLTLPARPDGGLREFLNTRKPLIFLIMGATPRVLW